MSPACSGALVGYDPGGDSAHGLAILVLEAGKPVSLETATFATTDHVVSRISSLSTLLALGVDTLTCWSTGRCAWRPADRWLRSRYPAVVKSVVSPNGLYGSMGLNGMAVLIAAKVRHPSAQLVETHPKILYHHLAAQIYDWSGRSLEMTAQLSEWLSCEVKASNEHEWDATLSAYAALEGLTERWKLDLHTLPVGPGERIIEPAGRTHYFWPS
jgi:hypothetical protein